MNPQTGELVIADSQILAGAPSEMAFNRTGTAVYYVVSASTVQGRRISLGDGAFSALPGADPFNPAMTVMGLAPHPAYDLLYAVDRETSSKARSGSADSATGEVVELADAEAPPNAIDIAADPLGRFVFAIGQDVMGR